MKLKLHKTSLAPGDSLVLKNAISLDAAHEHHEDIAIANRGRSILRVTRRAEEATDLVPAQSIANTFWDERQHPQFLQLRLSHCLSLIERDSLEETVHTLCSIVGEIPEGHSTILLLEACVTRRPVQRDSIHLRGAEIATLHQDFRLYISNLKVCEPYVHDK